MSYNCNIEEETEEIEEIVLKEATETVAEIEVENQNVKMKT